MPRLAPVTTATRRSDEVIVRSVPDGRRQRLASRRMRPGRPSVTAMLATAAALILLAGGAVVWFGSSGDDEQSGPPGSSVASAPERTEAEPTVPTETEPPDTAPAQPEPQEPDATPPATPTAEEPAAGGERKTTFPRERAEREDDPPDREFAIPPAREFSGTGNATLGTVNLSQPAVVRWTTKGRFGLRFGRENFPIVAPSPSGQLIVPPYNFEQVRVIASGRWKIT